MWKSVIYKEWLKIRWFLIGFAALGVAAVGYIFLMVQHDFTFYGGTNYWYSILFKGFQYFKYLKLVPLVGAIVIGIAQYFPETISKRIKLTFHLPLKENGVLMTMLAFGVGCLLASYLIILVFFFGLSNIFFTSEIIYGAFVSIIPWFLAGFTAYFFIALIVLEPVWKFRIFYAPVAVFFTSIYLKSAGIESYSPVNPILLAFTAMLSIALLFSAYRFRKGEM